MIPRPKVMKRNMKRSNPRACDSPFDSLKSEKHLASGMPQGISVVKTNVFEDEWQKWLIRTGLSPYSNLPVSLSGIYTDFN